MTFPLVFVSRKLRQNRNAHQNIYNKFQNSLRQNPAVLSDLREKLFILWGDLEERKRAINTAACNNAGSNDDPNPDLNKQIIPASTKPFICCIKEFGVKSSLRSDEGSSANDECRFGWERRFCMFGTTIV